MPFSHFELVFWAASKKCGERLRGGLSAKFLRSQQHQREEKRGEKKTRTGGAGRGERVVG